ncbi:MAG: hypothetical protein KJ600_01740 [Nanoarchaeota archaeon]|nr:hypothetical protein [Nanoarchaeota archaeon]MBU1103261.1 hypothetical protein [Nanoarchaeota archaeon]
MLTENEKKVLRYIAIHSKESPSINKVAKSCKITPNGAYKILKKFEGEGILKFKKISNIKSPFIDFKNNKSLNMLELALIPQITKNRIKYRNEDLEPLKKITEICALFGSYIEKKEPNDLDVLFVFDKKNYAEYKEKLNKVREITPIEIHDIIQTKKDLFNNIKNEDKTIINILEKGMILWGQNILVKVIKNAS